MAKKNTVEITETTDVNVEMEVIENSPVETKKEKFLKIAKKVGKTAFGVAKTATCAVGTVVLGAIAVGIALGNGGKNDSVLTDDDENNDPSEENFTTETAEEESIKEEFDI